MRYAYYYQKQGREKHAMKKYARLGARNAGICLDCHAPCAGACEPRTPAISNCWTNSMTEY